MRRNRAQTGPSMTMGPLFGPAQGVTPTDRAKEKARAVATGAAIMLIGLLAASLLDMPALLAVACLVLAVFLAKRAGLDLRVPVVFAVLAAYAAATFVVHPTSGKVARPVTVQAGVVGQVPADTVTKCSIWLFQEKVLRKKLETCTSKPEAKAPAKAKTIKKAKTVKAAQP